MRRRAPRSRKIVTSAVALFTATGVLETSMPGNRSQVWLVKENSRTGDVTRRILTS